MSSALEASILPKNSVAKRIPCFSHNAKKASVLEVRYCPEGECSLALGRTSLHLFGKTLGI